MGQVRRHRGSKSRGRSPEGEKSVATYGAGCLIKKPTRPPARQSSNGSTSGRVQVPPFSKALLEKSAIIAQVSDRPGALVPSSFHALQIAVVELITS